MKMNGYSGGKSGGVVDDNLLDLDGWNLLLLLVNVLDGMKID